MWNCLVAHGEGREGEKLRDATKQYIQEHEEDDRQAQVLSHISFVFTNQLDNIYAEVLQKG